MFNCTLSSRLNKSYSPCIFKYNFFALNIRMNGVGYTGMLVTSSTANVEFTGFALFAKSSRIACYALSPISSVFKNNILIKSYHRSNIKILQ